MDFKNILNQLDGINKVDVKSPKSRPVSTSNATTQTLNESVTTEVSTESTKPSLKDVFNSLMEGDVTMEPVKAGAMSIKSGDNVVGTAHTPAAANSLKQSIDKGEISIGDDEMNESDEDEKKSGKKGMSAKQKKFFGKKKEAVDEARSPTQIMKDKAKDDKDAKRDDKAEKAGKEVAKDVKYDKRKHPKKDGKEVTKDIEYDEWKEKKMPSISRIKKMCKDGCTQAKILKLHPKCDKQKLKDMIKKCKTNLKEGADHILKAAKHMGKSHGLCKGGYACPHDAGSEGARAYHEGYKEGLDECMGIRQEPIVGMVDEAPGTVATMASYGADDLEEAEVEEGNAFSGALANTAKGEKFEVGGNTYTKTTEADKNIGTDDKYDWNASTEGDKKATYEDAWAFESLEKELESLLNEGEAKVEEGVNISVQSGMEGQEDRVSVNATDAEADKLIKFVKDVGMGNYGDPEMEVVTPDVADVSFYGSESPSEEPSGSHDDMLKLMGIVDMEDDAEAPGTVDIDIDGDDYKEEKEACESCGDQHNMEEGCGDMEEGANMAAQYGPDDGSHNSSNDEKGNAAANAALASNDADTPQLVKEKESDAEEDDHAERAGKEVAHDAHYDGRRHSGRDGEDVTKDLEYDDYKDKHHMEEDQGYDDKEDESLGMRTGKESGKHQSMKDRRDDSYGKFGKRDEEHREISKEGQGYDDKEDESLGMKDGKESDHKQSDKDRRDDRYGKFGKRDSEHREKSLEETLAQLDEIALDEGSEASEEPTKPLSQHDDDNMTTEGAEDAPADSNDGSIEPVTETQTDDQREFAVAESEEDDLEEGKIPAGLKAYQDKKKGKKDDSDKEVDEACGDMKEEKKEEKLDEWANDAGKDGTETSFEQDIDFMTKVISGGLNKQKSTGQTTIPVIAGQNDRTGYNGADLVKEGSVMSHDGLAGLMNRIDELSK
jgi:hypothetical protein